MNNDALLQLICDALGLINRAFINLDEPRSVELEFYHQFRKLWDRGIPIGMGLGHLVIRTHPGMDLVICQYAEAGRPEHPLAAVWFSRPRESAITVPRQIAIRYRQESGWPGGIEIIDFNPKTGIAKVANS